MNLRDYIEKKMGEKHYIFAGETKERIDLQDAVGIAYGIMRDMGVPDNLDIEIEDENERELLD
jgi:hypothetical protein